ncbi:MAG TPA: hypothetical protein VF309_01635 [Usitatibacter sp.]
MTTIIPALALAGALLGAPAVATPGGDAVPAIAPTRTVNLDRPGALEAVAAANPGHYRKLVEILRVSGEIDCIAMPAKLYVSFGATGSCTAPNLLMTSFPAKRHVRLLLEDTAYEANVVIRSSPGELVPAEGPR